MPLSSELRTNYLLSVGLLVDRSTEREQGRAELGWAWVTVDSCPPCPGGQHHPAGLPCQPCSCTGIVLWVLLATWWIEHPLLSWFSTKLSSTFCYMLDSRQISQTFFKPSTTLCTQPILIIVITAFSILYSYAPNAVPTLFSHLTLRVTCHSHSTDKKNRGFEILKTILLQGHIPSKWCN